MSKSKRSDYEKKTTEYITPILNEMGFILYDLEYVKEAGEYYLRAYIDKEGGVTINDCVEVSRRMNEILDREDYISDAYTFEVSSPGVERVLKKDWHFEEAIGKNIIVKLYQQLDGSKEVCGKLVSYSGEHSENYVVIEINGELLSLQKSNVAVAKLAFEQPV